MRSLAWPGPAIVDACVVQAPYGHLLVLTEDGGLHGVDLDIQPPADQVRPLSHITLPTFEPEDSKSAWGSHRLKLHASANGEFAAVVVDYHRQGLLARVADGTVTLQLDGGDYHERTVPFSAAFVQHAGRDVLIHRSAWNRLDASDAATGELLTHRHMAKYEAGQPRPAHYLDYFHGSLLISPAGSRIFDDGWVWQPVAVPRTWSLSHWLDHNPWESEDGDSTCNLTARDDWNIPACWIDEHRLALWSLIDWDHEELEETGHADGVCIHDLSVSPAADRRLPLAVPSKEVAELFSDGQHLFVASTKGTTVWDLASGAQLGSHPGFVARLHDRSRHALLAFEPDQIVELKLDRPVLNPP